MENETIKSFFKSLSPFERQVLIEELQQMSPLWCHKILSSISETEKGDFTGITESDETFFPHSEAHGRKLFNRHRGIDGAVVPR